MASKKSAGAKPPTKSAPPKKGASKKVYLSSVDGVLDMALAKLESSGLTMDDAKQLGIEVANAAQTQTLCPHFNPLPSLVFNYFDIAGQPYKVQPKWPDFFRIRYLGEMNTFDKLTNKKAQRYTQPPNSGVAAYFPKSMMWDKIASDPGIDVIITEGELKAAKACKEGWPTIGLGGVWNFRSASAGVAWLPELEKINWVRRKAFICFDSDYQTKSDICTAINALADELVERGAIVLLVTLPQIMDGDNAKTGLDDFLVAAKSKMVGDFESVLKDAQPITLVQPMWKLNNEIAYVRDPGLVVDHNSFQKMAPGAFKEHTYATKNVSERVVKADGSISLKKVSAAGAWLAWPYRREVARLTYAPGKEKFHDNQLNIWRGWGCEPAKGDVKPFLELVDHIFTGADESEKLWFLRWLAYPLQFPGTKMFTSVVVHGIKHGTGKSLIGYTMGEVYGRNFTEISQSDLHASFNDWAEAKQFVMGDDVTGSNKRQDNDLIKKLITQKEIRINTKFVPTYTVPDFINYYFTSNHPDCFFLEDDDRRAFIWEVQAGKLPQAFYTNYTDALYKHKTLAPAVFHYLLNLDLGDFNPAAAAPLTDAKERMITGTQSELGAWCRKLLAHPDVVLKCGEVPLHGDLFTTKQLLALYDPHGATGVTSNGLGRELIRAGALHAHRGKPVKHGGDVDRYVAVRNTHKWFAAEHGAVIAHLNRTDNPKPTKQKGEF